MRIWEQKSAEVKTLRVQFDRIFEQFGNPETQPGEAILKSPNLATLIYYEEDKAPNGKPYEVRYVFNGKELWKYVSREKKVFIYKVKQNQENQGVFERGPLRFLFNMKLDDALRRYEVKLLPNQKDPVIEKTYHVIKIVPLDPNELQEVSVIYVWLQKSDFMPGIIRIQSGQRKTKEDFKFTKIERNGAVNERVFVGFKPEGWKAIDNPVGEDPGFGPDPGPAAKPGAGAVGANGPGRPANAKAANGGVMPRRN